VTVFVTTHFLEEAEYCDWVSFIDRGRLIADDAPENLRARFAGGYRIQIEPAPGTRAETTRRLAAAGITVSSMTDAIVFTTPTLEPATLAMIENLVKPTGSEIQIEQPDMTDVFRQVLANSGAAA
jgi:ABC-2 type transport system ATP-binding protein